MDRLEHNNIVKEVQDSFLDYSMSVITARAIPDLRDGLKPVHRSLIKKVRKLSVRLWVIITLMEILLFMKQW